MRRRSKATERALQPSASDQSSACSRAAGDVALEAAEARDEVRAPLLPRPGVGTKARPDTLATRRSA